MPRSVLAALALVAAPVLALPAAAQPLSTLLPQLTFPDPKVTVPATKGCEGDPAACPARG